MGHFGRWPNVSATGAIAADARRIHQRIDPAERLINMSDDTFRSDIVRHTEPVEREATPKNGVTVSATW